jgi:hypothetical protein
MALTVWVYWGSLQAGMFIYTLPHRHHLTFSLTLFSVLGALSLRLRLGFPRPLPATQEQDEVLGPQTHTQLGWCRRR